MAVPDAEVQTAALQNGDRIEYSVTHELDVDGDKAWVRYGVSTSLGSDESVADANHRVVSFVNGTVLQAATQVASQIMKG